MKRFEFNCTSIEECKNYIHNRAIQLLKFDVILKDIIIKEQGAIGVFEYKEQIYHAIYILEQYRKLGWYKKLYNEYNIQIITSNECEIEEYLKINKIPYIIFKIEEFKEYEMVQNYYNNSKAKRSDVYLMNHIDEGLAILNWINASELAKKAYCLHPIFQSDDEILNASTLNFKYIESDIMLNTIEYRSVANEYLSNRTISSINEIRLSPLKDVNDMLIADKIQNRKDFELYHLGKHKRSDILDQYFKNWLQKLNISESTYITYKNKLEISLK